jgi:Mn-dependent DtxR family transcriptional regulator
MPLYEILVNRPCVWILKELYEAEVINKKVYTIRVSDLKKVLKVDDPTKCIRILESNGLLHVDDLNKDTVISLNQKGKDFFKLFDKLKVLTESQVKIIEDRPIATVEYDLDESERKALFTVYKITQKVGNELPINALIFEDKQLDAVYDKLQKLNLIAKIKNPKGKGMTISLTPAGKRVIQTEFSEKLK